MPAPAEPTRGVWPAFLAAAFAFTAILWGPFLYIGYRWNS